MATEADLAKSARGTKILVKIEDPGDPGVFVHPCLINDERGFNLTNNLLSSARPNCTDPDAPSPEENIVDTQVMTVSGAGRLDTASLPFYVDWWIAGGARNAQIVVNVPGADGGFYLEAALVLESLGVTGPGKNLSTVEIALRSTGFVTKQANA